MNKHLKQLIDLSEVDKEIDAFEPQIDEVNYQYEAALVTKENIDGEISSLEEEMKNEELKKHKNELHLAELSAKLEENKKRSAEIKTEREMKSLQLEEEIAKEQVTFANEEIVRLDKLISTKKEKLEELVQKRDDLQENLSTIKADVDEKLTDIEKARHEVFARKEKLVGGMNQKGLAFYQKIRRWAKNTTAVEVKEQACMGCFMHVNDKVYADVIKGEEIVTCPHCGRILYIAEGEEA
ncbi:C4-type zinc ribbon domain-containing protein [Sulfurimonas sp. HSL-1716]|uniref:zinc ribbon domain-containing protein n=1 Tax=Hydrocurvibacter sulfurireducens TaxID=3131937 RepID=UPI0031F990C2